MLESREKEAVIRWLRQAKESGLLSGLQEVTIDMWDAYSEAVKEVFGDSVRVTIDRFHVMKNFQDRLNEARREIQNQLPKDQAKELKGSRWLWVTNPQNLTPEKRKELEALKKKFPTLGRLADHREALRKIFEDGRVRRPDMGEAKLLQWIEQGQAMGLKALDKFNTTLRNWMGKITNFFVARNSNGRTEGFNRGLRAILWRACGMRNFENFRLRVLYAFS